MMGSSVPAWRGLDAALSRLAQELSILLTWAAAAGLCASVFVTCYGIYAAAARRRDHARQPQGPVPPAVAVDDDVLGREVARGIAALEAWLAQRAPPAAGTDTKDGQA